LFWKSSLIASALFILYGVLRNDVVIVVGQSLAYFIYIRNLQLDGSWLRLHRLSRMTFFVLPFVPSVVFLLNAQDNVIENIPWDSPDYTFFLAVGGLGQLLLNVRFIYQWIVAERIHESVLPLGFWIISLCGSVLIITYGIYRRDPVLLVSQALGSMMYFRNLMLYRRQLSAQEVSKGVERIGRVDDKIAQHNNVKGV